MISYLKRSVAPAVALLASSAALAPTAVQAYVHYSYVPSAATIENNARNIAYQAVHEWRTNTPKHVQQELLKKPDVGDKDSLGWQVYFQWRENHCCSACGSLNDCKCCCFCWTRCCVSDIISSTIADSLQTMRGKETLAGGLETLALAGGLETLADTVAHGCSPVTRSILIAAGALLVLAALAFCVMKGRAGKAKKGDLEQGVAADTAASYGAADQGEEIAN